MGLCTFLTTSTEWECFKVTAAKLISDNYVDFERRTVEQENTLAAPNSLNTK